MSRHKPSTSIAMKTSTVIRGLAAVGMLGLCQIGVAENRIESWRFDTETSPAAPDFTANTTANCQAIITPGEFTSGWVQNNPVFGGASGVWDLGSGGTITCQGLAGLIGGGGQERTFTVRVKQYNDGGIYGDPTRISVPGATVLSSNVTVVAAAYIGDWLVQETRWKVPAAVTSEALQIVGAQYGSLVDEVTVETAALVVTPPPAVLAIRRLGAGDNQIEISWPAAHGGMVLEANPNPSDSGGWAPVDAPVQTGNGNVFVVIAGNAAAQFYRLKQP
jgi:hypothetical protein